MSTRLFLLICIVAAALWVTACADTAGSSAEKHLNAGFKLSELGQLEEAIVEYDEAIRLVPGFTLAYFNRCALYWALGEAQRAIDNCDKAISLDPGLAIAYSQRGIVYGVLGQMERAIEDLDEAIRLDPDLAVAYANRAVGYTHLGMEAEAQLDVQRAIELGFDRTDLEQVLEQARQAR